MITVPIRRLRVFVFALLPVCAYATVADYNDQFKDYTFATMASLGGLILGGAIAGMLHRLTREYGRDNGNATVRHPLLFVLSDLVGGGLAGVLMTLVAFGNNFPSWLVSLTVAGSAFAGSMLIEQAWQSLAKRYLPNNPDTALGRLVEKVKGDDDSPADNVNEGKFDA